jgi:hypothetical protein
MAELLRCRTCGYVVEAGKAAEVCPACGVPWKMMEPWKDPVARGRRAFLKLDLHPIILHFTISFAASAFVMALFVLVFPGLFRQGATAFLRGLVGVLPLAVIAAFVSGLFDGKVRFRRTTTPLLTRKKLLGAAFFLLSLAAALLTFLVGPYVVWVRVVDLLLLGAGLGCALLLGRIGGGLLEAAFPG